MQSEVIKERDAEIPTFQVVEVSRANIPALNQWPSTGWHGHYHWPNTSSGSSSSVIRTGDLVNITIWDSQENSLITNPGQRFTKIEGVEVDANGSVFLPYVNKVGIRGLTPAGARSKIQQRLEPIVPSAQVQLSLQQGRDHSVDVVGGVAQPGAFPMPSRNYKVLNVIADAGGIPPNLRNPQVRLLRGSKTYEISADILFADGSRNALLYPRDTIIVEEDDRSFVALGASGQEDLIYFPKDEITALEAMSLMGGLNDTRADPEGVLILREFAAGDLRADGSGPELQQVVFTLDLTTADGLFAARKFYIQPDDTVLATESPVNSAQTIIGLFGSVFGLTTRVANAAN
ncbi:polysaccharide biosynthesis/export family protein [Pseudoponticoccus marisrubri]|uniref:polysaccharide biosynthesis/export family protein n=1 Tax=Pseudoponticoccus marisrubri TaxID=1685382 RepID=UPI001F0AEDC0|nr:polysaccharide biosynthesis/export family protein [Pseudoponticoccus marisrubri]